MAGLKRAFALLIPLACAVLFVRLGLWQLERGRERAAINEGLAARLTAPPIPFAELPRDTASQRWQRVTLTGRYRYDLEQVQAGRTNAGSPGVHLITPFELMDTAADSAPTVDQPLASHAGRDTLVIVTRGWVYSANASGVDLGRWREHEGEVVSIAGYVLPLVASADTGASRAGAALAPPLRALDRTTLEARLGVPVAPVQVVMTSDSVARADSIPRRLAMPAIDPGPHRSYALQWFGFALIAVIGGVVLFRSRPPG
jgi:surfeit locus 1 family protein